MKLTNNYLLDHAFIAMKIQFMFVLALAIKGRLELDLILLTIIPGTLFYTLRELWQYFVQDKRHEGGFDWGGMLAPFMANCCFAVFIWLWLLFLRSL